MRVSTLVGVLAIPALASAVPIRIRSDILGANDIKILQFANVLEQLETQFYQAALQKFQPQDFVNAGYTDAAVATEQLQIIANDEQTHATVLAGAITALGAQPITTCTFDFGNALSSVVTTMQTARVVENVGVAAYLGAANLIGDSDLVTTAASILTIEARHSTILDVLNGGTAIPQAFDIPLTASQVSGIAGAFIQNCDLGFGANTPLTITNTGTVTTGTSLTFSSPALNNGNTDNLFCDMIVGGATTSITLPLANCVVPPGIDGPVVISISNNSQPLLGSDIDDQETNTVIAGPTLTFIDSLAQQQLAQEILSQNSPFDRADDAAGAAGAANAGTAPATAEPPNAEAPATPAAGSTTSASASASTSTASASASTSTASASSSASSASATSTATPLAITTAGPGVIQVNPGSSAAAGAANVGASPAAASGASSAAAASAAPVGTGGGLVVLPSAAAGAQPTGPAVAADGGNLGVIGFDAVQRV